MRIDLVQVVNDLDVLFVEFVNLLLVHLEIFEFLGDCVVGQLGANAVGE